MSVLKKLYNGIQHYGQQQQKQQGQTKLIISLQGLRWDNEPLRIYQLCEILLGV